MPPDNVLYPWQHSIWHELQKYVIQHRVPQALLLSGQSGIGKLHLAEQFSYALLCERPQANGLACGLCSSCLLNRAKTHPDCLFLTLEENEKNVKAKDIKIDQIRRLIDKLTLKPQFERYRVVIAQPADALNRNAVNAFLKFLEEPTERTLIILISDRVDKMTATIKSRCQKMALPMPDKAMALTWLSAQPKVSQPSIALHLAQGAPLLALSYAQPDFMAQRQHCFHDWLNLSDQKTNPLDVAEHWLNKLKLPESWLWFLLTSWIIDLLHLHFYDNDNGLYHPDLKEKLMPLANKLDKVNAMAFYQLLLQTRLRLDSNINKQVLFEDILIQWVYLNRG